MAERSFLSPKANAQIRRIVRRGFATARGVEEEPLTLTFRRRDPDTGAPSDLPPKDVTLVLDRSQPDVNDADSAERTVQSGTVKGLAPWDVRQGDYAATPAGERVEVVSVPPASLGIQRAIVTVETR